MKMSAGDRNRNGSDGCSPDRTDRGAALRIAGPGCGRLSVPSGRLAALGRSRRRGVGRGCTPQFASLGRREGFPHAEAPEKTTAGAAVGETTERVPFDGRSQTAVQPRCGIASCLKRYFFRGSADDASGAAAAGGGPRYGCKDGGAQEPRFGKPAAAANGREDEGRVVAFGGRLEEG